MSITAMPQGPSLEPELAMLIGSQPGISPALSQVRVPPGWADVLGAVVPVTCWMPAVGAAVTPLLPCAGATTLLRTVVVVAFLVVVAVAPALWVAVLATV